MPDEKEEEYKDKGKQKKKRTKLQFFSLSEKLNNVLFVNFLYMRTVLVMMLIS